MSGDDEDAVAAAGAPAELPAIRGRGEDGPGRNIPANGRDAAEPEPGGWDGNAAQVPPLGSASSDAGDYDPTDSREESLGYDGRTSKIRIDLPTGGYFRDAVVGEVHHHYHGSRRERRGPSRIPIRDLQHASIVHVTTPSDTDLEESLKQDHVVFCRGAPGSGRTQVATVVLDRLTGYDRSDGKVIVLDTATGLEGLPGQLEAGCGHLLDGSGVHWAETISRAQLAQYRTVLGRSGFLVILVETDEGTPLAAPAVDHSRADLEQVITFHLAARFLDEDAPLAGQQSQAQAEARAVIREARQVDGKTLDWFEYLTRAATACPAEAVLFADMIWDWQQRKQSKSSAMPRAHEFRSRYHYKQAAGLLRLGEAVDSPLRQCYALSAAVLDGLALNEVIDGAARLAVLFADVEQPGEPVRREVFAHTLARLLRHVEMASPLQRTGNRDGTVVVKMPTRDLARVVIELAWCEYDAARLPVLSWLMALSVDHPDDRVRIRAVQALAFIAAHDFQFIKQQVLDEWSSARSRRTQQLAASWLLEAMVLDNTAPGTVAELLRDWSRSTQAKRAVAVRAYGTSIASKLPEDAIQGVRVSAVRPGLGSLPELALYEMYRLSLTKEVTRELTQWKQGLPVMRERAGRVLVRISQIPRIIDGKSDGPYDLLWLLAHAPEKVGATLTQLAELWLLACLQQRSKNEAWQVLGRWAQSCRQYRDLGSTFTALADAFEKAAGDDDLGGRLNVYRRRWNSYIDEETQL